MSGAIVMFPRRSFIAIWKFILLAADSGAVAAILFDGRPDTNGVLEIYRPEVNKTVSIPFVGITVADFQNISKTFNLTHQNTSAVLTDSVGRGAWMTWMRSPGVWVLDNIAAFSSAICLSISIVKAYRYVRYKTASSIPAICLISSSVNLFLICQFWTIDPFGQRQLLPAWVANGLRFPVGTPMVLAGTALAIYWHETLAATSLKLSWSLTFSGKVVAFGGSGAVIFVGLLGAITFFAELSFLPAMLIAVPACYVAGVTIVCGFILITSFRILWSFRSKFAASSGSGGSPSGSGSHSSPKQTKPESSSTSDQSRPPRLLRKDRRRIVLIAAKLTVFGICWVGSAVSASFLLSPEWSAALNPVWAFYTWWFFHMFQILMSVCFLILFAEH